MYYYIKHSARRPHATHTHTHTQRTHTEHMLASKMHFAHIETAGKSFGRVEKKLLGATMLLHVVVASLLQCTLFYDSISCAIRGLGRGEWHQSDGANLKPTLCHEPWQ